MSRNFREMLEKKWSEGKFVCVGLDSDFSQIPASFHQPGNECAVHEGNTIVAFNRAIVEATHDLVCAYKPNSAFYEELGREGMGALSRTISDIHAIAPDVSVILDAKRADIGNTNAGYVRAAFNIFRADAITVHPYLGKEALRPFLDRGEKGIFVLCRTSNPGAKEFQDRQVLVTEEECLTLFTRLDGSVMRDIPNGPIHLPLYQYVACRVANDWNKNGNCALVVGATYPDELREVRGIVGDMPILIPGIGKQGGDLEATVRFGQDSRGKGMVINSSRGIIFAENPRGELERLHDQITQCLKT